MAYFMVVLVVALVVGPLFWIMPSAKQRRQTELRNKAVQHGLVVALQAPPGETKDVSGWVAYRAPIRQKHNSISKESWYIMRSGYEHGLNYYGLWRWQNDRAPTHIPSVLKSLLDRLPNDAKAVGWDKGGAVVFWREERDCVELLAEILTKLRDTMLSEQRP